MARDIQIVMRDYFESHASSMPALIRVIEQEFILLVAILARVTSNRGLRSLLWQRRSFMSHFEKWSFSSGLPF